jgi:membrane protein
LNEGEHQSAAKLARMIYTKAQGIGSLLRDSFYAWIDDNAPAHGAALAYYTVFALAPLLIIVIAIAGLVFGREAAQGHILSQIQGLVGEQGGRAVQAMLENARQPGAGIVASVIGLIMLIIASTGVFAQLQVSLDTIWRVTPKPGRGILGIIRDRLLSFLMVLVAGFLLLVSLVLSAALAALGKFFSYLLPVPEAVLHGVNFVVSFAVITLLFAAIYKVLPDAKISWSDVWIGAAVTSLLFSLGKFVIGLYLGKGSVASAYGAAGSLVIILVWVYYSAQILLYGAEFTAVYAIRYGSRIVPTENAVALNPSVTGPPPTSGSPVTAEKRSAVVKPTTT